MDLGSILCNTCTHTHTHTAQAALASLPKLFPHLLGMTEEEEKGWFVPQVIPSQLDSPGL